MDDRRAAEHPKRVTTRRRLLFLPLTATTALTLFPAAASARARGVACGRHEGTDQVRAGPPAATMRWTNRPTLQQAIYFSSGRGRR
jgi:hypothetical protein